MKYVGLLRGINVGGTNKIDMKTLKHAVEEKGMTEVSTYINSGNILFADDRYTKAHITHLLEQLIFDQFALQIHVLIYSADEFQQITEAIPAQWSNDAQMKSDVLFLWQDVDTQEVLKKLTITPEIDHVLYVPGAVLWSVDKDQVNKSGLAKIVGTKLYRRMTVRNVNTVRKIWSLLA